MSLLSSCQYRLVLFSVFVLVVHGQQTTGLGSVQQQVPWRAGHASAYLPPYVIVYGGSEDITTTMSSNTMGSTSLWAWDSRNGSWYHPTTQVQGGVEMLPQVYHKATSLSGQSTMVALVSNTTGGQATGVLQKLDINSWSWSFPTSNFQASAKAVGFTMTTLNNTIYTYGGLAVNANGFPNPNAVQNTLSLIDTNSFQIAPGSNGLGLTDHSTCYLKKCNCLVTFGGTTTGNPTEVTDAVNLYDLNAKVWNVQGINTVSSAEKPGARRLHTANCLDDAMIVYGGGTDQPSDTNVWILNATNYPQLTWQRKDMVNATLGPNLRMGHTSVYDEVNKKIYMFGGWGVTATNDSNIYVLDTVNWSWNKVATTGYPSNGVPWTNITSPIDTNTPSHGLGAGTIAGIAVGVLLALLALAVILFYCIRKRQREQRDKDFMVAENLSETMSPHDELKRDTNPYNEPQQDHEYENRDDGYDSGGYYTSNTHYNSATGHNKRASKAWTGTMSTQQSFTTAHRSEIGDSERVVTGILEEVDDGTVNATHGSHSPRNSFRNSKVLLVVPSTDISGQGQVPNEIISQKPNEFSIPAHRLQQHNIPIQHVTDEEGAPLSSSMEVLRSIKTNPSSMVNQPGSQFSHVRKNGIPITHATIDDDDEWNTSDSVSVHNKGPIQYILPNSHQLSTATSTQTWDTTKDQRQMVHHHYPSSTLNMPMAEAVTPPVTTNNSSHELSDTPATTPPVNIYNSVSPLDALASLGQSHTPSSSRHGSSTILKDMQSGHSTPPLLPLINALPRRYQLDKSKSPITGPTNNILFAINSQDKPVALKAFGRREAWERECKTLIKLKSSCVVEILEVLTIQSEHPTTTEEVEGDVKYVTVMERLDETLNTFIRKQNNTRGVARDILKCLAWCHDNGIAFCDLKPSNIMHDKGNSWKLIDFEASRTIDEECVGVITPRYCPPEVARATTYGLEGANGVVATASVDLWSFGCILYELETNKALFPSNIKDETVLHFVSHPSPSTPILNNGLRWNEQKELEIPQLDRLVSNAHTRQLIKTLLKRDPSKRGSASQLLENPYFL